jgi:hypothetical protein
MFEENDVVRFKQDSTNSGEATVLSSGSMLLVEQDDNVFRVPENEVEKVESI